MPKIRSDLEGVVYVEIDYVGRVTLVAGDEIPDGAVVGDHLIDHTPEPEPEPETETSTEQTDSNPEQPEPETGQKADEPEQVAPAPEQPPAAPVVAPVKEPARSGPKGTTAAWKAYAEGLGIDVPDDAQRDDIIDLVDARKES